MITLSICTTNLQKNQTNCTNKIKKNSTTKKFRNNKRFDPKISRLRNDE